jgi:hypothetical protein
MNYDPLKLENYESLLENIELHLWPLYMLDDDNRNLNRNDSSHLNSRLLQYKSHLGQITDQLLNDTRCRGFYFHVNRLLVFVDKAKNKCVLVCLITIDRIPQLFCEATGYVAICRFNNSESVGMVVTFGMKSICRKTMLARSIQQIPLLTRREIA